jgi:hypothetical protein
MPVDRMLLAAGVVVATLLRGGAAANCSAGCEDQFLTCVDRRSYDRCARQIENGGRPMVAAGCVAGCEYTSAMLALGSAEDDEVPHEMPDTPTLCSAANQGRCECANLMSPATEWAGMKTYTWWVQSQQRCFTVYTPPSAAEPMPVLLSMDCYAKDRLRGLGIGRGISSKVITGTADRFGVAWVALSTPDGNWHFNEATNPGFVVNDTTPMRCEASDMKDIAYLEGVFSTLEAANTTYNAGKVYTYGFSQNGMAAGYFGICFQDKIAGAWQGGAGMGRKGLAPPPAGKQGTCADCQYWPVYPCYSEVAPFISCMMTYENDRLVYRSATANQPLYMYDTFVAEGHDGRMLIFPEVGKGHRPPYNQEDWIVGCLGVTPSCSASCESALSLCMDQQNEDAHTAYSICMTSTLVADRSCVPGCAPTLQMLQRSEAPTVTLSKGTFGASLQMGPSQKPGTSMCTSPTSPWDPLSDSPGAPAPSASTSAATSPPTLAPSPTPSPLPPLPTPAPAAGVRQQTEELSGPGANLFYP